MEVFVNWLFAEPLRTFAIVIAVCLCVIVFKPLLRLFHYVNPPGFPESADKVTIRHAWAEAVEAEKALILANSRARLRAQVDQDTADALSYTALAQAIANLKVSGEDTLFANALTKTLTNYAISKNMNLVDAQMYSKTSTEKVLDARIKRILDRAEEHHHRKMKLTDIEVRKIAYLVKKELEKDGLSGQANTGAES